MPSGQPPSAPCSHPAAPFALSDDTEGQGLADDLWVLGLSWGGHGSLLVVKEEPEGIRISHNPLRVVRRWPEGTGDGQNPFGWSKVDQKALEMAKILWSAQGVAKRHWRWPKSFGSGQNSLGTDKIHVAFVGDDYRLALTCSLSPRP